MSRLGRTISVGGQARNPMPIWQYMRPSAASNDGNWTRGGTDSGTLYGQIDEASGPVDGDYIQSEFGPSGSSCRVKLSSASDPGGASTGTDYVLKWRFGALPAAFQDMTFAIRLYQGGGNTLGAGTLITSYSAIYVQSGIPLETQTIVFPIPAAAADAISDFTNLYVEFSATQA